MEVTLQTPDLLVLADRAVPFRVFGALFAVIGILLVVFAPRIPTLPIAVGWGALLIGVATALLPRNTTVRFDRHAGVVVLERRGLVLRGDRRELPLGLVERAEVERVVSGKQGATFRVRLVLRDRDPLPLTMASSSGEAPKAAIAATVTQWLAGTTP